MNNLTNRIIREESKNIRQEIHHLYGKVNNQFSIEESTSASRRWQHIERASFIFGILGFFVTSYFAVMTYYNTEQIEKLDTLVRLNTESIQTLVKVTNELKQQNKELQVVSMNLSTQLSELKKQNDNLALINSRLFDQLGEVKIQRKILNDQYNLDTLNQSMRLHDVLAKRKEDSIAVLENLGSLTTERFLINFKNYDSVKQLNYILHVQPIINSILNNRFLEENEKLFNKWRDIKSWVNEWSKNYIRHTPEEFGITTMYLNGPTVVEKGIDVYRKHRKIDFDTLVDRIYKGFTMSVRTIKKEQ